MLGRYHDRGAGDRLAAFVPQRDLALGVWFQEGGCPGVAVGRHGFQNLVAVIKGGRHQVGRVVGGVSEHDTLIASAFVLVAACIYALRDVRGLSVEVIFKAQSFPMETILFITDPLHRFANGAFNFFLRARRPGAVFIDALAADFAGQNNKLCRRERFAGNARFGVFGQEQVDDRVGNLVGDLVGMTFGYGFGREEVV